MAENAVVDTGVLYNKINSQLEELRSMLSSQTGARVPDITGPVATEKKKRAKPNLSEEQIAVLKERLVKAREAKKAKRLTQIEPK